MYLLTKRTIERFINSLLRFDAQGAEIYVKLIFLFCANKNAQKEAPKVSEKGGLIFISFSFGVPDLTFTSTENELEVKMQVEI